MTAVAEKITEPGVYEDVLDEVYHADPVEGGSLSSTGARRLQLPGCPAKYRWEQDHPREVTKELNLGRAAHHQVLGIGPELVVIDAENWRTKAAKEARNEAHLDGAIPLLPYEMEQIEAMAAALRAHPIASALLRPGTGRTELTLVWRDVPTGVMLRARLDKLTKDRRGRVLLVDYKTAVSAEPTKFEKAIHEHGYHQQLDFYKAGVMELGLGTDVIPLLVAQEKTPPYVVTVVQPTESAMFWGGVLNRAAIEIFAQCQRTGVWPGYSDEIVLAALPGYAERQYEDARERGDYDIKEK